MSVSTCFFLKSGFRHVILELYICSVRFFTNKSLVYTSLGHPANFLSARCLADIKPQRIGWSRLSLTRDEIMPVFRWSYQVSTESWSLSVRFRPKNIPIEPTPFCHTSQRSDLGNRWFSSVRTGVNWSGPMCHSNGKKSDWKLVRKGNDHSINSNVTCMPVGVAYYCGSNWNLVYIKYKVNNKYFVFFWKFMWTKLYFLLY